MSWSQVSHPPIHPSPPPPQTFSLHTPFVDYWKLADNDSLAWAEMYLSIGKLVRTFDMQLYDVVRERDIDVTWDYFLGEPEYDTKGVRVKVVGLLD